MSNKTSDSTSHVSGHLLSPFSSGFSLMSEVTSDDPPDLGAFGSVFRELSTLQNEVQRSDTSISPPSVNTDLLRNASDYESDAVHSTVWNHDPIRSYLSSDQDEQPIDEASSEEDAASDTEDDKDDDIILIPSLGALDSALDFLAGEREKLAAQAIAREDAAKKSDTKPPLRSVVSPRRKRRRKRRNLKSPDNGASTIAPTPELSYSSAELSSSPDGNSQLAARPAFLRLSHSRSTPNLLFQAHDPPHPEYHALRELAAKLALDFPENAVSLATVPKTSVDESTSESFVDPRGPVPLAKSSAPLVHIFIDHSNILIGFLSFLKRNPSVRNRKVNKLHMSHAALTLVLERGRSVTRRVMAASSPLYQPMSIAELLGYEVRVFARVPDNGDSMDRLSKAKKSGLLASGVVQGDSDSASHLKASSPRVASHSRTQSNPSTAQLPTLGTQSPVTPNNGRVRYREQGVDELLQLKLHQAIVDADPPPIGSTIVLATGDGNIGEFNEEGFLGCVRTALKKGWKVELYAWEEGLSRAWSREFGETEWKNRFRIIGLEKYGAELLLI